MTDELLLRREMVQACKVLYACKAVGDGLGGHLSARLPNQRILIKPRRVSWWKLAPEDFVVIDFHGARVDDPAKSSGVKEWPIHARTYAARQDVNCVLHAHPVASTLMAALGIEIEPLDQDCAGLTGQLPMLENGAVSISTPALGDGVARALGTLGVLLKNHGNVVCGAGIAEVCVRAHKIEKVAETMLRAASLREPPFMDFERKVSILAARKGVESVDVEQERWRMLKDYHLVPENG